METLTRPAPWTALAFTAGAVLGAAPFAPLLVHVARHARAHPGG